jgi:hypothetical protein
MVARSTSHWTPADVSDQLLRMAALSLIGAIALVVVEWQDGQLDASIDELIDYFVDVFLAAERAV